MTQTNYSSAFKAYDIRALWGDPLDEQFFYALGYGIGKHLIERYGEHASLVFGADSREENTQIIYRFLKGVALAGKVQCINAGLPVASVEGQTHPWGCCSTAMLYWIAREQFSLGISFTASHNPVGYVGCKMVDRSGQLLLTSVLAEFITEYPPLPDFDPQEMEKMVYTTHHRQHPLGERVLARAHEMQSLLRSYAKDITHHITVVVDGSGGAACAYEKQFLMHIASQLPLTFLFINMQADSYFSAHETDTVNPHNYKQLGAEVEEVGAIFGVLFDGDADRLGCVDEKGAFIPGDIFAVGLVEELLRDAPKGKAVVYDISCTSGLPACITCLGGKPVPSRIGQRYIREHFDAQGAYAGIELSGHISFAESHGHESPLIALLLLIRGACRQPTMSGWLARLAPVYKPGVVNLHVADAAQAIATIQSQFVHLPSDMTDGIKITGPDRWFLMRASNTEPLIRIAIEAPDKVQYDRLLSLIQEALRAE